MATELDFNDNFFASIIPDAPADNSAASTSSDANNFLSQLFGNTPAPTAPAAPATAPAKETPAEQPKTEEAKVEEPNPAPVQAEEAKTEEATITEEVKATAEPAPAPVAEAPAVPEAQEEAKAEAEPQAVPEAKAEEAPAPKAEEVPAEQPKAEEVKAEPEAEPVKAEAPATEDKAEEVTVEVSKPKRAKRTTTKRATAKKETQKLNVPETGKLDENFIPTLLLSVGSRYEQYKQEIQELMNEIELTPDMNKATVQTMIAKQTKLAKMIEFYGEGYHDALENLAGKDGMIDRIVLRTAQETEGTATEKKDAGRVACMNYVDPKTGEHQDLMQWKKGLESAVGFFSRAADYCKTIGVALSTYSKLY